jgi:magnesium chelatase family protein
MLAYYAGRVSGSLSDRFDLPVEVHALRPRELAGEAPAEPSAAVAQRVAAARAAFRVRRVARTIAGLEGCAEVSHQHVAEVPG